MTDDLEELDPYQDEDEGEHRDPGTTAVYVFAYSPGERNRQVRIVGADGVAVTRPCDSQQRFEALVEMHRPGIDLTDPERVCWVDHPGEWSGV
ncbi:hypothetical protein [Streptacidiphilus carbonis]|uniref:hypothetical protein n=1 Tax=Streptacidiphilus carbonis TaxID=105422 RepID=UPI0005AB887C|nr:hypothetical protein [Streptacidiphilus carbonis]